MRFRGLLAPGGANLSADDDLQAIWRTAGGQRFQNYRARFTVLDVPVVRRAWISHILQGETLGSTCPPPWRAWVEGRSYSPLLAPSTRVVRTPLEQLPSDRAGHLMLDAIHRHFSHRWTDFEACAVQIWRMIAPATGDAEVTRAVVDHGRDAIGVYELGPPTDRVPLDFVLEAKCYAKTTPVGVSDMSRLISRIRHRMFGVFVTTSFVNRQAYAEVREDGHPIVIISGRDIVDALRSKGYSDVSAVQAWLDTSFPIPTGQNDDAASTVDGQAAANAEAGSAARIDEHP